MKRVAPTHTKVYQAPTIELQCNWLIPEIAINILQHLYYRDIASFSCSCKQTYHLIEQENFWPKLVDAVFSSNEAPEKLNPRRKLKIYSNLIQNRCSKKSIKVKHCDSVIRRIVCQNHLVFSYMPVTLTGSVTTLRFKMIDLKELKMIENHSIERCAWEMTACQDQLVLGSVNGQLDITSNLKEFGADKSYRHCREWARLACDPESKIVAAVDKVGTILVWKIKDEPAPSQIFSIPTNTINDLSVGQDVVVARSGSYIFSLHYMSEKLVSKTIVLPDVSHAAVYQGQLVTSHNELSKKGVKSPVVKIWDAKTIELKETINLAQLSWEVNPENGTDCWIQCNWTKPCMEGVFVSEVVIRDVDKPCIIVWNLKTKKGSILKDVDPIEIEDFFLIHDGLFITMNYDHTVKHDGHRIFKFFDFSNVEETAK
ncbi:MAG TPA: F-box protein [Rhabdochlamydiaceae bacterium]|nr:F-box protein [Rhabdochlamydiaceae bacterium]